MSDLPPHPTGLWRKCAANGIPRDLKVSQIAFLFIMMTDRDTEYGGDSPIDSTEKRETLGFECKASASKSNEEVRLQLQADMVNILVREYIGTTQGASIPMPAACTRAATQRQGARPAQYQVLTGHAGSAPIEGHRPRLNWNGASWQNEMLC